MALLIRSRPRSMAQSRLTASAFYYPPDRSISKPERLRKWFYAVLRAGFWHVNSTLACQIQDRMELVAVEENSRTLPSSIFFDFNDNSISFGRAALSRYVDGAEGRLMRSLKSVLGSSLMEETTRIKTRVYTFKEIIGLILGRLKAAADAATGADVAHVVLGRPVHFVDDNPEADRNARDALEEIARAQGFRKVAFQYEPIAAALAYEQSVTREEFG